MIIRTVKCPIFTEKKLKYIKNETMRNDLKKLEGRIIGIKKDNTLADVTVKKFNLNSNWCMENLC